MIDIVVLYCFIVFYIIWRATLIVNVALQKIQWFMCINYNSCCMIARGLALYLIITDLFLHSRWNLIVHSLSYLYNFVSVV